MPIKNHDQPLSHPSNSQPEHKEARLINFEEQITRLQTLYSDYCSEDSKDIKKQLITEIESLLDCLEEAIESINTTVLENRLITNTESSDKVQENRVYLNLIIAFLDRIKTIIAPQTKNSVKILLDLMPSIYSLMRHGINAEDFYDVIINPINYLKRKSHPLPSLEEREHIETLIEILKNQIINRLTEFNCKEKLSDSVKSKITSFTKHLSDQLISDGNTPQLLACGQSAILLIEAFETYKKSESQSKNLHQKNSARSKLNTKIENFEFHLSQTRGKKLKLVGSSLTAVIAIAVLALGILAVTGVFTFGLTPALAGILGYTAIGTALVLAPVGLFFANREKNKDFSCEKANQLIKQVQLEAKVAFQS